MDATQRQAAIGFFADLPSSTLRQCVRDALLLDEDGYDQWLKNSPQDPVQARRTLAEQVVDHHEAHGRIADLLRAAGRLVYRDPGYSERLTPLVRELCGLDANQQAALAMRAHTLSLPQTLSFVDNVTGKICLIAATTAAGETELGTGLLVGPDLVLTAYHTLRRHIVEGKAHAPAGGTLFAIFEHCGLAPVDALQQPPPAGVVRVAFHAQWLLACCEHMPGDGLFAHPDPAQQLELPKRLDFALVRLAEPVGRHTRQFAGGKRRRWWDISRHATAYAEDEQIIIPQHPNGMPQRIGFGRYREQDSLLDTSHTRIRYNTETDKGSSGAPCFNQNFEFVGLHNAAFTPTGVDIRLNQAVRADRILAKLQEYGQTLQAPGGLSDVPLWSVSENPATPRPILGRAALLRWIERAADDAVPADQTRCYYAHDGAAAGAAATRSGIGLSFSAQILRAARAGAGSDEPVVVLGADEVVPARAEDFVATLAHHLRVPPSELMNLPRRPSADSALAPALAVDAGAFAAGPAPDIDKLDKWTCDDLPDWLNLALRAPLRPGQPADERPRYRRVWVVLDNLHREALSSEVENLIAGLMGAGRADAMVRANLRGLRWVFLGAAPRIALDARTQTEALDPLRVGMTEIDAVLAGIRESNDLHEDGRAIASSIMQRLLQEFEAELSDPKTRLRRIQKLLGSTAGDIYARYGKHA